MCGRFALSAKTKDIEKLISGLRINEDIKPRYNISPTQKIPLVLNTEEKELMFAQWGLIPHWAKDATMSAKMINARAETLTEKPTFRNLIKKKRCAIFADGFYEWKKVEGKKFKLPYLIRLTGGAPFLFAGLWDSWKAPEGDRIITCTIITTTPNSLISQIHDRMPVILNQYQAEEWLSENDDSNFMHEMLQSYPSNEMNAFEVTSRVNNPAFDDILCTEPAVSLFN